MKLSTFDAFKHADGLDCAIEISGDRLLSLQKVLMMMLSDFDEVCTLLGISYTLGGGSCLGAVRHKGFIPWDDDLDLNMPRRDFERFASNFDRLLGDKYWLHIPGKTPGYDLCFPRLRLKGTVLKTRDDFGSTECGVYIDIFLIENAPSNSIARFVHGFGSMALGFLYSCRRFAARRDELIALAGEDEALRKTVQHKATIGRLLSFMSMESWCRTWDGWNGLVKNESTGFVVIPVGRKHYFGELYPREEYLPPVPGIFEKKTVPLPANPDAYLKALYGDDYMKLPQESEREHHVVVGFDLGAFEK